MVQAFKLISMPMIKVLPQGPRGFHLFSFRIELDRIKWPYQVMVSWNLMWNLKFLLKNNSSWSTPLDCSNYVMTACIVYNWLSLDHGRSPTSILFYRKHLCTWLLNMAMKESSNYYWKMELISMLLTW